MYHFHQFSPESQTIVSLPEGLLSLGISAISSFFGYRYGGHEPTAKTPIPFDPKGLSDCPLSDNRFRLDRNDVNMLK
jgi:hypothetical protein